MDRKFTRQLESAVSAAGIILGGMVPLTSAETPSSTVRETTTVTVIEVPVVVLEGNTPVRGLSADDFVILQDGVEQTIASFEQVNLSLGTMERHQRVERRVSLAGRRYFLLAFDLAHTQPHNARRAVGAARDLLQDGLHPTDLVGISVYSALAGARLLYPFTSDHRQLDTALLAVEAVTSRDPEVVEQARATLEGNDGEAAGNLMRFLGEIRVFTTQQGIGLESTVGPAGDWLDLADNSTGGGALMTEILLEMEAEHQKNIVNVVRDRSIDLLETLADLASALEEVRGQKYFVLFSEGIDETIFENPFDTRGTNRLAGVLESFRRSGWVVHSIDVGGVGSDTRGMYLLSRETGGQEYRNFNALNEAMGRMLEKTSVSYVLSFQPEDVGADGSYHRIEVRVKRPGRVKVRHRDGYFAPLPSPAEEEDLLVAVSDQVGSFREGGSFELHGMAAAFKRPGSSALVSAVLEIDGPTLLDGDLPDLLQLEVNAYLMDQYLSAVPLSTRHLTIDVGTHGDLIRSGGIKVLEDLLLGPGEHSIRFVVLDQGRDQRSVVTLALEVPDFHLGDPQILQPFFPEVSPEWLVVRQGDSDPAAAEWFPYQFGEKRFMPQAGVSLKAGEIVPVCVMAFDLGEVEPQFQLELVTADGVRTEAGQLQIASTPEVTAEGLYRVMVRFETTGLEVGAYEIRVIYNNTANEESIVGSRTFEIRPSEV